MTERPAGGQDDPRPLLAIDTAGTRALVAVADAGGDLRSEARWVAGYRHGEELLARVDQLLTAAGLTLHDVGAIACGTGPGAFTGVRVGLATAKALAVGLAVPIVGVATSEALLASAAAHLGCAPSELALLLPAGPSDRVLAVAGVSAALVRGGDEPATDGRRLVAVDLEGRAPDEALALGRAAEAGLGAALARLAVERLRAHGPDDVAHLVPEYVTLPRGVAAVTGEVRWSHDRG